MKFILRFIVIVAWALWFGGAISTLIFASHAFKVLSHDLAGESNSAMFVVFGEYQLALAGVALFGTGLLLITYPSKRYVLLLWVMIFTGGLALISGIGITQRMDQLRRDGQQKTEQFKKLHIRSMTTMLLETSLLLLCGGMLILPEAEPQPAGIRKIIPGLEPKLDRGISL